MRNVRKHTSLATIAFLLACSGPAVAQAPIVDGYGGAGSVVDPVGAPGPSGASIAAGPTADARPVSVDAGATGNRLPFTGLDVALIVAGGLLLLSIGVGARWLSRPRTISS